MLIILDRDGVINQDSDNYIKSPAEWIALSGSLQAIAALNQAGHQVVVATNQSGVGRGYYSEQTLHAIHKKMQDQLAAVGGELQGIYYCPHTPTDNCDCRKPKPGLLKKIAKDFSADLSEALLVGDSLRDIQAAQAVNCPAVLVLSGQTQQVGEAEQALNIPIYDDLSDFAQVLLAGS